jgi:proteasome accessory factor B
MSRDAPAQRLLSLMAVLLDARGPLTLEEIQTRLPDDYGPTDEPADPDPEREKGFQAGRRKFLRDKEALADMGVVVRYTPDDGFDQAGYWLQPDDIRMPEVHLAPDEVRTLRNAARLVAGVDGFPLAHDLEMALAKLDAAMAGADLTGPDDDELARSIRYQHRRVIQGTNPDRTLATLADAVVTRRVLRIQYRAVGADAAEREVEPYALFLRRGVWYLVGWCRLRDAIRVFDVHRMHGAAPVGKPQAFAPPPDFDLARWRDAEPWELEVHPPVTVRLHLDRSVAGLANSRFPRAQVVERPADGAVVIDCTVTHNDALIGFLMSLWGRARIVSPADLVRAFHERVRGLVAAHDGEVAP